MSWSLWKHFKCTRGKRSINVCGWYKWIKISIREEKLNSNTECSLNSSTLLKDVFKKWKFKWNIFKWSEMWI